MNLHPLLRRRLLITAGLLTLIVVGGHVPIPGFRRLEYLAAASSRLPVLSLFSIGIIPWLTAAAVVTAASGVIAPLRRLRDGSAAGQRRFDLGIVILGLLLTALQAAVIVRGLAEWADRPVSVLTIGGSAPPGGAPLFLAGAGLFLGAAILIAVAHLITRYGLGNGIAWILTLGICRSALEFLREARQERLVTSDTFVSWVLLGLAVLAAIFVSVRFVSGSREVPLAWVDPGTNEGDSLSPGSIRIPLNPVGLMPAVAGMMGYGLFSWVLTLAGFESRAPQPDGLLHWLLVIALIALAHVLLVAWGFHSNHALETLRLFRTRIPEAGDAPGEKRLLDRISDALLLPSLAWLLVLFLLPHMLGGLVGIPWEKLVWAGPRLLVVTATLMQVRLLWRSWEKLFAIDEARFPQDSVGEGEGDTEPGAQADPDPNPNPDPDSRVITVDPHRSDLWITVARPDTRLEAELLRGILTRSGVTSILVDDRWFAALGTLDLWGWSRPAIAALIPHRRLGGGALRLLVAPEESIKARRVLDAPASPGRA